MLWQQWEHVQSMIAQRCSKTKNAEDFKNENSLDNSTEFLQQIAFSRQSLEEAKTIKTAWYISEYLWNTYTSKEYNRCKMVSVKKSALKSEYEQRKKKKHVLQQMLA